MIDYIIKIDLQGARECHSDIVLTSGDSRGYGFCFVFCSNGKRIDPSGYGLAIKAKRPDGRVIFDSGETDVQGGSYLLADEIYQIPGTVEVEVALTDTDESWVTSCVLVLRVREGFGEGKLASENVAPILAKISAAAKRAELATESAETMLSGLEAELNERFAGKVDAEAGKGLSANDYTDDEKNKLNSAWEMAEVNRTNLNAMEGVVLKKIDAEPGKGLSTNDYSNEDKEKLALASEQAAASVLLGKESGYVVQICTVGASGGSIPALLSADGVVDFSTVTVYAGGINLYDDGDKEVDKNFYSSGKIVDINEIPSGSNTGVPANVSGFIPVPPNATLTINFCNSWVIYDEEKNVVETNAKSSTAKRTIVVPSNGHYIRFSYHRALTNSNPYLSTDGSNVMVVVGDAEETYFPFIAPMKAYTVDANGRAEISDVVSYMSITTDAQDVAVSVEYQRDINFVVRQLTNAIISLGGNV